MIFILILFGACAIGSLIYLFLLFSGIIPFKKEEPKIVKRKLPPVVNKIIDKCKDGTFSRRMLSSALIGFIVGTVISILFLIALIIDGDKDIISANLWLFILMPIIATICMPVYRYISSTVKLLIQGNKGTKAKDKAVNQALADSGTPFAAGAKKNLAAMQAKEDKKAVIKSGVIGGIIGGTPGAIIGAAAKKTEIDSKNKESK